jgi:ribosomal protein L21E
MLGIFSSNHRSVSVLSRKLTRFVAGGSVAVVVATSGLAIANSSSSAGASGTATAAQPTPSGQQSVTATIITGTAADKAEAAARAAKYSGTLNGVVKLSDGSYVVLLTDTGGQRDVFVSKDFKVTGSQ